MEVSYTYDAREPDRKMDYMTVADARDWKQVLQDLDDLKYRIGTLRPASLRLIEELKGWGIEA